MEMSQIEQELLPLKLLLQRHQIYRSIKDLNSLRSFMQTHVYSVWDFMCLLKFLQHNLAGSSQPWRPPIHRGLARFINEIVLGEESDELPNGEYISHLEMYCLAMQEVGADCSGIGKFLSELEKRSWEQILTDNDFIPGPAQKFMQFTHDILREGRPHQVAAAFAFGRENIIPAMFSELLDKMKIESGQAPSFYFYLRRHVELDGDHHGPMALQMIHLMCGNDEVKWQESLEAAKRSILARINLWDELNEELTAPAGRYKALPTGHP